MPPSSNLWCQTKFFENSKILPMHKSNFFIFYLKICVCFYTILESWSSIEKDRICLKFQLKPLIWPLGDTLFWTYSRLYKHKNRGIFQKPFILHFNNTQEGKTSVDNRNYISIDNIFWKNHVILIFLSLEPKNEYRSVNQTFFYFEAGFFVWWAFQMKWYDKK